MADNNQQRSSTSLFGQSTNATSQSVQEIMRERQEASRARRKWLFSWLLPLVIVIVLGSAGTAGLLKWMEFKKERDDKARAAIAAKDPMRGVTVFGNEDAALKLEFHTEDMVIAPQEVLTVLHRAVGIKPFKVRLDTVNLQLRESDEDTPQSKTQVFINGKSEVEYLDEKGLKLKIEIEVRSFDELNQVLEHGGVDRIMLDNFSVPDTKKAVDLIAHRYETESSGGITFDTIRDYAEQGVDFVSVGALTHSVKGLDMSFKAC